MVAGVHRPRRALPAVPRLREGGDDGDGDGDSDGVMMLLPPWRKRALLLFQIAILAIKGRCLADHLHDIGAH